MKKKALESLQELERNKMLEESRLEQYSEQVAELEEEIAQLERDVKNRDEELECRKQVRLLIKRSWHSTRSIQ